MSDMNKNPNEDINNGAQEDLSVNENNDFSLFSEEEIRLFNAAKDNGEEEPILEAPAESAFSEEDLALFRSIREDANKAQEEKPEPAVNANEDDALLPAINAHSEEQANESEQNEGGLDKTIRVEAVEQDEQKQDEDMEMGKTIKISAPSDIKGMGKKSVKRPWWQSILLGVWSFFKIIFWYLCLIAGAGAVGLLIFHLSINQFEDPELDALFANRQLAQTTEIYAIDPDTDEYELITEVYLDENREWVNYEDMPKCLIDALVAIEDERFWSHNGVDWKRTAGAVVKYIAGVDDFGGSTITQQLIKNITGDNDYSWQRKAKEILRALYIEKRYDKDEILEYYLNTVYFNYRAYGVGVACEMYFDKSVTDINAAEAASLVSIVQMPNLYEPYYNPDNNAARKELVLEKMLELGTLTQEEFEYFRDYHISFNPKGMEMQYETNNSYYVDQVINDVIADLAEQMDITEDAAEIYFYSAGLKVYTCLDQQVQDILDYYFIEDESWWPEADTEEQYQSAMYIMNPYTGQVMGMAGGRGEKTQRGLNRATQSPRQTGSAIKPLSVYAPGIEEGVITLGSIVDDVPLTFMGSNPYPQNVSRTFLGLTDMYTAIRQSLNATPSQILQQLTYETPYEYLTERLHFQHLSEDDIGVAAMAMGGMSRGATVAEMVAGYAALANKGVYTEPITYTKVESANGKVLIEKVPETNQAFSEETAWLMQDLLVDSVRNGFASMDLGLTLAGKTGTTDNNVDKWYMCYSEFFAAGIWVGFDENNQSLDNAGVLSTISRYAFQYVMEDIVEIKGWEGGELSEMPDTIVRGSYCKDCGGAPTANCSLDPRGSRIGSTYYKEGTTPSACTCHTLVYICTESGMVAHNGCPEAEQQALVLTDRNLARNISIPDAYYLWMNIPEDIPVSTKGFAFQNVMAAGQNIGKGSGKKVNHLCTEHDIPKGETAQLYNPNTAVPAVYTVTPNANAHATLSFTKPVEVNRGKSYSFTVTAAEGYEIFSVSANSAILTPVSGNGITNHYTIESVEEDYSVTVKVKKVNTNPEITPSQSSSSSQSAVQPSTSNSESIPQG